MKVKYLSSVLSNISFWRGLGILMSGIFTMVFVVVFIPNYAKIFALYILPGAILGVILIPIFCRFPEIFFTLFLTAGCFKGDPRLESILPKFFDLTVFFGAIVVLSILYKTLKKKLKIPRISNKLFFPYIILVILMFVGLFYTEAPIYGLDKFLRFITITTLAIFGPLFLFTDIKKFHRFLYILVAISSLMVMESIISYFGISGGFRTAFGSNYLALGRITGISALMIIYYFLVKSGKKYKFLWTIVLLLNLFGLLFGGGKAPVISFLIALVAIGTLSFGLRIPKAKYHLLKISLFFLFCIILVFIFSPDIFGVLFARLTQLVAAPQESASLIVRLNLFKSALRALYDYPILGTGVGGYSFYAFKIDTRAYPHNIFLEVASELGIIGLFLLIFLIGFCFFYLLSLRKKYKEKEKYFLITMVLALFVFMFLNSCASGDINDNRLFFVWIGSAYALNNIFKFENLKGIAPQSKENATK